MKNSKQSRHAPAFILLFLARGPNYGAALLNAMEEEMPHFLGDSAMIYRTLRDLEADGSVEMDWRTPESGPPKKYYTLTKKGWQRLSEFEQDILKRRENLNYFLNSLALLTLPMAEARGFLGREP